MQRRHAAMKLNAQGEMAMGRRTILVVEDEMLIGAMIEDALIEAGYRVALLTSGEEAMALLDEAATGFGAVVTDIRLGNGCSGWDVARFARERDLSVGVVYVSGDSGAEWYSRGVPGSLFVQKPFAGSRIVTAVTAALDPTGGSGPRRDVRAPSDQFDNRIRG